MEEVVRSTVYTIYGVDSILESIMNQVIRPLKILRYGPSRMDQSDEALMKRTPPKLILFHGPIGCGKKSLTSAIVNELRRGASNKQSNVLYSHRNVKYLQFHPSGQSEQLSVYFNNILRNANASLDGRDFTVLQITAATLYLPSNNDDDDANEDNPELRRRTRRPEHENLIKALIKAYDSTPPGKWLIILHTKSISLLAPEILKNVDLKFKVPYPNKDAREEIIFNFFKDHNAVYASDWDQLVSATRAAGRPAEARFDQVIHHLYDALSLATTSTTFSSFNASRTVTVLWDHFHGSLLEPEEYYRDEVEEPPVAVIEQEQAPANYFVFQEPPPGPVDPEVERMQIRLDRGDGDRDIGNPNPMEGDEGLQQGENVDGDDSSDDSDAETISNASSSSVEDGEIRADEMEGGAGDEMEEGEDDQIW